MNRPTDVKRSPDPGKPYFFPIENEFIDSGCFKELNKFHPSIAAVYFILKRYRNRKTGWSCPTIGRIVKNSGYSKTRVCKATKALEMIGLIEKKQAGKQFNFRMNYRIRNHDRFSLEKIADTIPNSLEQCYKKRTIPSGLDKWQNENAQKKDRGPSDKDKCHTTPSDKDTHTIPSDKEKKNLIREEDYNKEKKEPDQTITQILSPKAKNQKTRNKITPKKLSAEFDKTKDAGEKAFKTIVEEIQTKSKIKPPNQKTIEGMKAS